jgi:hypothetical protein
MVLKNPWIAGEVVLFFLHGACSFWIRRILKSAGFPVARIQTVKSTARDYKTYWREAPSRGWFRSLVPFAVLCLVAWILMFFIGVKRSGPERKTSTNHSQRSEVICKPPGLAA